MTNKVSVDEWGNRSVKMWGFTAKSVHGVRSIILCVDMDTLDREREKMQAEGFVTDGIEMTDYINDPDDKHICVIVL